MRIKNGKVWAQIQKRGQIFPCLFLLSVFFVGPFFMPFELSNYITFLSSVGQKECSHWLWIGLEGFGTISIWKKLLVNHYYQDGFWKAGDAFIVDRRNIHITKSFQC